MSLWPRFISKEAHLQFTLLLLDEDVVEYRILEEDGEIKLELLFEEIDEDTDVRTLVIGMIFGQ